MSSDPTLSDLIAILNNSLKGLRVVRDHLQAMDAATEEAAVALEALGRTMEPFVPKLEDYPSAVALADALGEGWTVSVTMEEEARAEHKDGETTLCLPFVPIVAEVTEVHMAHYVDAARQIGAAALAAYKAGARNFRPIDMHEGKFGVYEDSRVWLASGDETVF